MTATERIIDFIPPAPEVRAPLPFVVPPHVSPLAPPADSRRFPEELREPAAPALTAWDKVRLARHLQRPHALDYIRQLCSDFFELRGDRTFADDPALIAGVGRTASGAVVVLGQQKGSDTRENVRRNFGMSSPEGYRKALRMMRHAEKFGMPLICLIDTPGARPDAQAEERGQGQAIAQNLLTMASLPVPIVATVIGEGGSGGALGIGLADRLLMLEHTIYSVASPEASAAILWRDASKAPEAAAAMKITAQDLHALRIVDEVIPEPGDGAHTNPQLAVSATVAAILRCLEDLRGLDRRRLIDDRYAKYRSIGSFYEL